MANAAWFVKAKWSPDTCQKTDTVFQNWGAILPWIGKRMSETGDERIGTCARIEISQDADNADQKVTWFLKVYKTYKLLWEAYIQFSFSPSFY